MNYTFTHDEHDVYVIDDFITKSECKVLTSAYLSMKEEEKEFNTKKGGERDGKSCFYSNYVRTNSPYVPTLKRIRAKSLELLRYLYDNVPYPVAIHEATLLQECSKEGMDYHCDPLKRNQPEPYLSKDLAPHAGPYGYGVYPPNKGEKDYWQPHFGEWTWGHALHRAHTAILYLSDDFDGGDTNLPFYDINVTPKQGRVLCFKGISEHEHGVRPVSNGNRYTYVVWTTNNEDQEEGKRMNITPYTPDAWVQ